MHHKIIMKFFSVLLVKIELYAWNPVNGKMELLEEDSSNNKSSDDRLIIREMSFLNDDKGHAKSVFHLLQQKFYDDRRFAYEKKKQETEIKAKLA